MDRIHSQSPKREVGKKKKKKNMTGITAKFLGRDEEGGLRDAGREEEELERGREQKE